MKANEEELDLLHDDFLAWYKQYSIPIETYAESIGLYRRRWIGRPLPLGLVVPRASANTGVGSSTKDIDADHLSLVKPASDGPIHEIVYRGVLRFVQRVISGSAQAKLSGEPELRALIREVLIEEGVI